MRYKRKDYFRYEFKEPIRALFRIQRVGPKEVHTSNGEAKIIDISPRGMKLNASFDIPHSDDHNIGLLISFQLNEEEFQLPGTIVWKRRAAGYNYGIDINNDETETRRLVNAIKVYAATNNNLKEV